VPRLSAFPKGFFAALMDGRMSVLEWIDLAASLGVDGVELYPGFLEGADLGAVRAAAERHGLALPMLCHSPDFTRPDPDARRREVERTRDMLRVTAALGGGHCRVLSGQNRPGLDAGAATEWVVECLWALVDDAAAAGVVMCLENHYKDGLWEYPEFAQSSARYLTILDAVDSPWLKAQYDPSNAVVAEEDPYALLERVLPRVATMHASDRRMEDGTLLHGVIGEGANDYDRIFATLAAAGFDGWVSIEDGEGPTVPAGLDNLRRSADFLRAAMARHFRPPTSHERMAGQPWDASYADGPAPWDLGGPQPAIVRLAFSGSVLDAGCGTGENALHVAAQGRPVLGVDVAPSAIAAAREAAARRGLPAEFAVADALHLDRLGREFDTVLDSGLFHTFDAAERRQYVASLASVTRRAGRLYVLCFSDAGPDPGPHPVSEAELRAAFADWQVVSIRPERIGTRFHAHGAPGWLATLERV
jgi:sugar phosphate isomerase/epimerase/SAM-dependent methyltransferase